MLQSDLITLVKIWLINDPLWKMCKMYHCTVNNTIDLQLCLVIHECILNFSNSMQPMHLNTNSTCLTSYCTVALHSPSTHTPLASSANLLLMI